MNLEEIWKAFRWPVLIVLIILALIFPRPSKAQANCAPRAVIVDRLVEQYGEARQAVGLTSNALIELFANDQTGSWTFIASLPDGTSCVMAAGHEYQSLSEAIQQGDPL